MLRKETSSALLGSTGIKEKDEGTPYRIRGRRRKHIRRYPLYKRGVKLAPVKDGGSSESAARHNAKGGSKDHTTYHGRGTPYGGANRPYGKTKTDANKGSEKKVISIAEPSMGEKKSVSFAKPALRIRGSVKRKRANKKNPLQPHARAKGGKGGRAA